MTLPAQSTALPSEVKATTAAEERDRAREERLLAERLKMLAKQARRYPLPVLISAAFLAVVVWRHVSGLLVGTWVVSLGVILLTRWVYCRPGRQILEPQAVRRALRTLLMLSIANGTITGLAVVFFFHRLPPAEQSIFSMVIVCWAAGAVSANAAYQPAFYAYVVPILSPLAIAWAADRTFEGIGIALLIVLFLVIQAWLAKDNERVFRDSFERDLEHEQLLHSTNQFVAAASHDLRQTLAAVGLLAANLEEHKDSEVRSTVRNIGIATNAVERQLTELLDFVRLEAGVMRPKEDLFALESAIEEALQIERSFANRHGLTLRYSVDPSLWVRTDRVLLGRILGNLLHNAINYTARGGVTLAARVERQGLVVEVSDTGCGIPPEQQKRIFEKYYRVDGATAHEDRGLGLGLANVNGFIHLLGLGLDLSSTPSVGSTFSIIFPPQRVERVLEQQSVAPAGAEAALPRELRVLVIDDDAGVRAGMAKLVEQWGCVAFQAGSTEEAASVTTERAPQFVLADYRLGPVKTGIDAVKLLRAKHGFVPALIVSAQMSQELLSEAVANGLAVLDKSSDSRLLKAKIAAVLEQAQRVVESS